MGMGCKAARGQPYPGSQGAEFFQSNGGRGRASGGGGVSEWMAEFAEMKSLDTWYAQVSFDAIKEYFRKDPDISARLAKGAEKCPLTQF
jgi:hypothetical protein